MAVRLMPDVEALAGTYLRAHADVAAIAGDRIGGKDPRETADPWVKITHILGEDAGNAPVLHFGSVHLQLDCYGSDDEANAHEEAKDLVLTVQAALHDMPQGSHSGAVVTRVSTIQGPRLPDQAFPQARERYVLDAWVWIHPV